LLRYCHINKNNVTFEERHLEIEKSPNQTKKAKYDEMAGTTDPGKLEAKRKIKEKFGTDKFDELSPMDREAALQLMQSDGESEEHSTRDSFGKKLAGYFEGTATYLQTGNMANNAIKINKAGEFETRTCFVAGMSITVVKREYHNTVVLNTASRDKNLEALIPIEEVQVGDYALSKDETTNNLKLKFNFYSEQIIF
jgi:hypothetical protein